MLVLYLDYIVVLYLGLDVKFERIVYFWIELDDFKIFFNFESLKFLGI